MAVQSLPLPGRRPSSPINTFEGLDYIETRFTDSQPHLLIHRFKGRYGAASNVPEVRVVLDRDGKLAGLWIKPWQDELQ